MADERNTVAPDASTPQTPPSGQGVNAGNSTPNEDWQAKVSQLEQRLGQAESRAEAAEREAKLASRKADRVREQITNRIAKKIQEKEEAIDELAAEEGWDEATKQDKKFKAKVKVLSDLKLDELNTLDTNETPQDPAPKFPTQQQAQPVPYPGQGQPDRPLLNVDAAQKHLNDMREAVKAWGISESDFGEKGLLPYVLAPEGSDLQFEFMKKAIAAREKKAELAKEIALRQQREQDAQEVADELEASGGLGGNGSGSGGGSPANNLKKLEEQLKEKYRGTGRIAEYNAELEALRAKYAR